MRRTELVSAIRDITQAFEKSQIAETFERSSERSPESIPLLFAAMRNYARQTVNYGEIHNAIIDIFGLKDLSDPDWWSNQVTGKGSPDSDIESMYHRVRFFRKNLPSILTLLQYDYEHMESQQANLRTGTSVLKIILFEEANKFSSPQRLVMALEGITELYDACARIEKVPTNTLSVVACDAGSDKSFDFLGVAKVFEEVRLVMNDMWDKIVYFRYFDEEKRIELVIKHLKLLETTGELVNDNHISNEEAEIIKKHTMSGVKKLMKAGVATDELEQQKAQDPRQLLSPEPKLLTVIPNNFLQGDVEIAEGSSKGKMGGQIDDLSPEEIGKLKSLIAAKEDETDNNDK